MQKNNEYTENELWSLLDILLEIENNVIDSNGIDKFNRLVKQGSTKVRASGIDFTPDNSIIKLRRNLTLESISNYEVAHNSVGTGNSEEPLVFLYWNFHYYIVDGTHRINSWETENIKRKFSAVEVSLKQVN